MVGPVNLEDTQSRYDSLPFIESIKKSLNAVGNIKFERVSRSDWNVVWRTTTSESREKNRKQAAALIKKMQKADIIMGRFGAGIQNAGYASWGAMLVEFKTKYGMNAMENGPLVSRNAGLGYYFIRWCGAHLDLKKGCPELIDQNTWRRDGVKILHQLIQQV